MKRPVAVEWWVTGVFAWVDIFLLLSLFVGCVDESLVGLPEPPAPSDAGTEECQGTCPVDVGECRSEWVISICGCAHTVTPKVESCNGLDDDCNGLTDDGVPLLFDYPSETFPGTAGVGECRPSVTECQSGSAVTYPPRTPTLEETGCGDERDNDCDGFVDEDAISRSLTPLAVSFVVDVSGSMATRFEAIRNGLCSLARGAPTGSVFSLVAYGLYPAPGATVDLPFTEAEGACVALDQSIVRGRTGGEEYQIEGVLAVPSWPVGFDEHVILVSDERTHLYSPSGSDFQSVVETCRGAYEFHAFLLADPEEWWPVLDACGGNPHHSLGSVDSAENILSEFRGPCHED